MRVTLVSLLLGASFAAGCADCSRKEETVPAPPQQQQPLEHTPVTSVQYKKVMDLHPPGIPKPFAPGSAAAADASTD